MERSVEYAQRALANDPTMSWAKFTWAASYLSQAEFALWSGKEPTVFTERCVSIVTESLRQNPQGCGKSIYSAAASALARERVAAAPEPTCGSGASRKQDWPRSAVMRSIRRFRTVMSTRCSCCSRSLLCSGAKDVRRIRSSPKRGRSSPTRPSFQS